MKTIEITIRIAYDPDRFPEDDMRWAADKVTECDPVWNIGYDFDAFSVMSKVVHGEVTDLDKAVAAAASLSRDDLIEAAFNTMGLD